MFANSKKSKVFPLFTYVLDELFDLDYFSFNFVMETCWFGMHKQTKSISKLPILKVISNHF